MGQLIFLCMVAFAGYFLLRAGVEWTSWLLGSRHRAYRQLAARFRGRYESRGLSEPPTVSFPYEGSHVRVGMAPTVPGQPQPPRTRVVVRFRRGIPFRLELYPLGRPAPAQPPKGTRLVQSGVPEFDRAYVLQSNDGDIAAAFLVPWGARASVEDLRRIAPPGGMLLSINPERLLVQV